MPWAPERPCTQQPCPRFAVARGRCREHAQQHEQQRRPVWITAFYSSAAWQHLRTLKRVMNPLCQDCEEAGRITPVESVDHVVPITVRPDLRLVLENLRSLCTACHDAKTRRQQ